MILQISVIVVTHYCYWKVDSNNHHQLSTMFGWHVVSGSAAHWWSTRVDSHPLIHLTYYSRTTVTVAVSSEYSSCNYPVCNMKNNWSTASRSKDHDSIYYKFCVPESKSSLILAKISSDFFASPWNKIYDVVIRERQTCIAFLLLNNYFNFRIMQVWSFSLPSNPIPYILSW